MKSHGNICIRFLLVFICFSVSPNSVIASEKENAVIPSYSVSIDGVHINNVNSEYPFLNYEGITYFPMTWNILSWIGLNTNWSDQDGFNINSSDTYDEYRTYENTINDFEGEYNITIPLYEINVNGVVINNAEEEWPFINYNGVTYFPMTWENAVIRFGWKLEWNEKIGLSIATGKENDLYLSDEEALSILNNMLHSKNTGMLITIDDQGSFEISERDIETIVDEGQIVRYFYHDFIFEYADTPISVHSLSLIYDLNEWSPDSYAINYSGLNNPSAGRLIGLELSMSEEVKSIWYLHCLSTISKNENNIEMLANTYNDNEYILEYTIPVNDYNTEEITMLHVILKLNEFKEITSINIHDEKKSYMYIPEL